MKNNNLPSVAIIIVNWNSYSHTNGCLLSLRKVKYGNFKAIVVDNGSTDGSDNQLESEFPEVVLLRNKENLGFTGGNNRGISHALESGFDYLMLLNNDTEVEEDFLDALVDCLENDSSIGAVQPKFYFLNNKERIWNAGGKIIQSVGWIKTIGENRPANVKFDLPQETAWITGCGFLVRSALIKEIGGLNDRFFIYFEDVDWSLRIKSLGYKLYYCPKSVVYHEAGMSNKKKVKGKEGYLNPIVHYLATRNNILLLRKYTPWYFAGSVILFQGVKYAGILSYFLVRKRFEKIKFVYCGLKDGLFSKGI
jgi:GT2 family glycosyltransferase